MPKKHPRSTILGASLIFKSADGGGGGLASEAGKVLVLFNLTTPRHRPVSADFGIPGKSKMGPKPHFWCSTGTLVAQNWEKRRLRETPRNLMKNWSKKGSLWKRKIKPKHYSVVQNHTFGLFEKKSKNRCQMDTPKLSLQTQSVHRRTPGNLAAWSRDGKKREACSN